jgi:hypothetical protein
MKSTLLQMVQSILSDMDSEDVNTISDTVEAQQIASVIEDTYYNIIAGRDIPEHKKLMDLTALADSTRPTHFKYPTNVKQVSKVSYNTAASGENYTEVKYVDHDYFLESMNQNGLKVETLSGNLDIFVSNDTMPTYYTSFDDENIIMNAYDASIESTLQQSKTRAFGSFFPTFSTTDSFVPDLDETLFPYFLAEAKSTCFSLFKSGTDPKVEQAARRLKSHIRNDLYKTEQVNKRPMYGRT